MQRLMGLMMGLVILGTGAASGADGDAEPAAKNTAAPKILVVYYSHSNNTRQIANYIQELTGADIFAIQPVVAYPADHDTVVKQGKEEIAKNYKPALKGKPENLDTYDIVFVGTPNWWSTIAPPVATFLTENDLSGKIVVPFCTHGGGGLANVAKDMAKLCPQSTLRDAGAFLGRTAKDAKNAVAEWLKKIGVAPQK